MFSQLLYLAKEKKPYGPSDRLPLMTCWPELSPLPALPARESGKQAAADTRWAGYHHCPRPKSLSRRSGATAGKHFLPNADPQVLSLFPWAEYQLSKPEVVSRLEEEEELWSVERGVPQDTFSGESQARGVLAGNGLTGQGTGWGAGVSVCRHAAFSSGLRVRVCCLVEREPGAGGWLAPLIVDGSPLM